MLVKVGIKEREGVGEMDADEPGLGVSTAQSSAWAHSKTRHTYTHAYTHITHA